MDKKVIWWIVIVAAVVLIGYGLYGSKGTEETAGSTIKVGVALPLTGDAAVYGEPARNMVQLAADEINQAGGVNGKTFELIFEDAKCNGRDAANAIQKLVNVDKVQVILGGFCSSESLAGVPIAEAAKVALFSAGSSSPDLTGKSSFFFRNYPSDASQGSVLAEIAYNNKKWKKVAFMQEQLDYPLGVFKAFDANFTRLGGQTVKEEFPSAAPDFRSQLSKLRAMNPDALFIDTQTPAVAERILKQLTELKWKVPLLVSDAVSGDPKTVEANKAALEGALAAEFGVDLNNAKFQHMIEAYKAKFGAEPPYQSYAQTEYDAVFMIRDAVAAVGYDGQKVAEWSRTVKNWPGASGLVTIGADGDRVGGHVGKVIRNGKVEIFQ